MTFIRMIAIIPRITQSHKSNLSFISWNKRLRQFFGEYGLWFYWWL